MAEKNLLTYQGLKDLEDELQELKVNKRQEIAQKLKEARAQGDLSENAEYDAAKDEQRDVEARIETIEKTLKNAIVADEEVDSEIISFGSKVVLLDIGYDELVTYKIVGSTESDILKNKISNESPLGIALIGKKIGDILKIEAPAGEISYRVVDINRK